MFQPSPRFDIALLKSAAVLIFHAGVSYFNNYFLFNWFLLKRQYATYIFTLLLIIALACYPQAIIYHRFFNLGEEVRDSIWTWRFFLANALSILLTVAVTGSLKLLKNWYQEEQFSRSLRKIHAETELKFLKSQINPHFLFNSLNNLYALTLIKSEQAPEVVLRLSNILRYVLYETSDGKVPLEKEVEYLRDYVELEKIRLGQRAHIELKISGDFSAVEIEPMMLLTLVENSFKHGTAKQNTGAWVTISLERTSPEVLHFQVSNSKVEESTEPFTTPRNSGIGLNNLKKRLDMLYQDKHKLMISDTGNRYTVDLYLNL
ncbi:MAG: histidine kinase [Bacteroidetes bacterium]|nr:histidine kinase [Bacteroidota bacterium]